jgi:pectate lyase C
MVASGTGGGAAGAAAGRGGAGSGGASAAGSGGGGSGVTPGNGGTVNETIVVKAGETFDGGGKRYRAGSALGDGSQSESQKPVFKLEDGATLINVVLGSPAADGIHCHGDVTLRNIVWEDIGEDAMTIKESGTVTLDGGSAANGDDKVFQINAPSTFKVSNFKASNAGKFIRQNGDTTFKIDVVIDKCDISNMKESIFRTDSSTSTVQMTNTRYSKIGKELFMGVSAGNIKTSNNTEY